MHKVLALLLVFFLMAGFKWGASASNAKDKSSDRSKAQAVTATKETKTTVPVPKTATAATAQKAYAPTGYKTTPATAVSQKASATVDANVDKTVADTRIGKAMGASSEDELAERVASLARVSRALSALNESKAQAAGKTQTTEKE
ncbi:MAG: hypothetical protein PHN49_07605 [Candidatus Omnitrophica bacterium]|nr:hypothetical protein [Candidatus Omnitrophota bacterium]MDD5671488.1 hypothetical protein [Candidatus Omnitrophota bacterium]